MIKLPFTNFEGQKYELRFRKPLKKYKADGLCHPPDPKKTPKLYVDPTLVGWKSTEITIHELTHAFFWDLTEEKVELFSKTIVEALRAKEED